MKSKPNIVEIGAELCKRLVDEVQVKVVHRPDHPFLFDSPDLLIASPGNLLALFLLRVKEQQSSDSLFARLAVARLALPRNLRCVLMIPEIAYNHKVADFASDHLHEAGEFPTNDSEIEKLLNEMNLCLAQVIAL